MDLKSDDIFNADNDATIWLSYELDKLNLDNQLDIESALLSVEDNKISETTNSFRDTKIQDLKMSVTNVQSVSEELKQETDLGRRRDINGNEEECSSEENLNHLFENIDLSDSDNEAVGEEESCELRERGPVSKRLTRRRNRTNNLERYERHDRSQFPPGSLTFWAGSTVVLSADTPVIANQSAFQNNQSAFQNNQSAFQNNQSAFQNNQSAFQNNQSAFQNNQSAFQNNQSAFQNNQSAFQNNQSFILNTSDSLLTSSSNDSISSPRPVIYEDLRVSAVGSPESGYESSFTGSPPRVSSVAVNYPASNLDLIPETDPDIVDIYVENTPDCALPGHNDYRFGTDDKNKKEQIKHIYNFLIEAPDTDTCPEKLSSCLKNVETVPDTNACSAKLSPCLRNVETTPYTNACSEKSSRNVETHKKIDFKLKEEAKDALWPFLSNEEYRAHTYRLHRQINVDIVNKREIKAIQLIDEIDGTNENRTNLHHAVLKSNIEEIYSIIEVQKQYKLSLKDINIRDKNGKTALDYAVQKKMTLVVDYLKENTACQNVTV